MQPVNQNIIIQPVNSIEPVNEKSSGIELKELSKKNLWAITGMAFGIFSYSLLVAGVTSLKSYHHICASLSSSNEFNSGNYKIFERDNYLSCMASRFDNFALIGTGLIAARISYACFKKTFASTTIPSEEKKGSVIGTEDASKESASEFKLENSQEHQKPAKSEQKADLLNEPNSNPQASLSPELSLGIAGIAVASATVDNKVSS